MMTDPARLNEMLDLFIKVSGIFIFGYLIFMGILHRRGSMTWLAKERTRRKSIGMPVISLKTDAPNAEVPWKDPLLIQGGFKALSMIAILSVYILIMVPVTILSFEEELVSIDSVVLLTAMYFPFPIVMTTFGICMAIWTHRANKVLSSFSIWMLIAISIVATVLSVYLMNYITFEDTALYLGSLFIPDNTVILIFQVILLVIISLILSYLTGMEEGIKQADIEERFPLVEVRTNQDKLIKRLRLYEKTDIDYRFIGEDGMERIIPMSNVQEIRPYSLDAEKEVENSEENANSKESEQKIMSQITEK